MLFSFNQQPSLPLPEHLFFLSSSVCDSFWSLNKITLFMVTACMEPWYSHDGCALFSATKWQERERHSERRRICLHFFVFKSCFEPLLASIPRNSSPLNGFYYPAHVWGGFLEAFFEFALPGTPGYTRCLLLHFVVLNPP